MKKKKQESVAGCFAVFVALFITTAWTCDLQPTESYRDIPGFDDYWTLAGNGAVIKQERCRYPKSRKYYDKYQFRWTAPDGVERIDECVRPYLKQHDKSDYRTGDEVDILVYDGNFNVAKISGQYRTKRTWGAYRFAAIVLTCMWGMMAIMLKPWRTPPGANAGKHENQNQP